MTAGGAEPGAPRARAGDQGWEPPQPPAAPAAAPRRPIRGSAVRLAVFVCALALPGLTACAPETPGVRPAEVAEDDDEQAADTADTADTAAADSAPRAAPLVLREPMPLTLEIRSGPALRGTAEVYSECRVVPTPEGGSIYEVATTTGEFQGGAAALGLIVSGFTGPGSYEDDVTVTLVLGRDSPQPELLAGRTGCVVGVQDLRSGSFACDPSAARAEEGVAIDSGPAAQPEGVIELVGSGTWRCP